MRRALSLVAVLALFGAGACAEAKPVVRTALDIARELCVQETAERNGVSVEEAVETFCKTETQLDPWLEELLAAKQRASLRAQGAGQ